MLVAGNAELQLVKDRKAFGRVGIECAQTAHLDLKKSSVLQNRKQATKALRWQETTGSAMIAGVGGMPLRKVWRNEVMMRFKNSDATSELLRYVCD